MYIPRTIMIEPPCAANTHVSNTSEFFEAEERLISKFGERMSLPDRYFELATFFPLTGADVDYFKSSISVRMLNFIVTIETWLFNSANGHQRAVFELAKTEDTIAWGLSGLSQSRRADRQCAFLQMALLFQKSTDVRNDSA